jgi:two-component system, OmpR family, sensor kinase
VRRVGPPVRLLDGLSTPLIRGIRRLQWEVGQRLSVRAKLTLWYGAMCVLTLTLVGFGMKTALDYRTTTSLDPILQQTAQRVSHELSQRDIAGPKVTLRNWEKNPFAQYPDIRGCSDSIKWYCVQLKERLFDFSGALESPGVTEQVQITAQGGPSIFPVPGETQAQPIVTPGRRAPVPVFATDNPIPLMTFLSQTEQQRRHLQTVHSQGETFRVYLIELQLPESLRRQGVTAILEVLQNEHTYLQVQADLTLILLIGLPLGAVVALLAGWWIARAALRPIERISRTVQSVGESRDLGRRVNFVGPEDEVGRLAATFDGMLERLEHTFESQKRFIADASHELRTPLTAIRGNADLMRIAPPSERDLCLTAIRRESERMTRLVSDLLLLAEADLDESPVHMQPVDLASLMSDVYQSALAVAGDRVHVLQERNEDVTVMADADRIKQLVLNLVDNAVKFTGDGGGVTLSLTAEPNGATIDVADSGIGIPLEEQHSIFERFYRVEASRHQRGSGLGLAICAWIVQMHGGEISVRSEPDKGSRFTVRLPGRIASPRSDAQQEVAVAGA